MSSLSKDGKNPSYWREVRNIKIPRHRERARKNKIILRLQNPEWSNLRIWFSVWWFELWNELKEGPGDIG